MKTSHILTAFALCLVQGANAQYSPLTLHYDRPAQYFEEAMVIGNGNMGGIIYSGTGTDRIALNDITLWAGEPESNTPRTDFPFGKLSPNGILDKDAAAASLKAVREALQKGDYEKAERLNMDLQGHYSRMYQPLGELRISYLDKAGNVDTMSQISQYKRWLDISNAMLHTRYFRGTSLYDVEYFATAPDSAMVIRIKTDSKEGLHLSLAMSSLLPSQTSSANKEICTDGYAPYFCYAAYYDGPDEKRHFDADRGIHFRTIMRAESDGSVKTQGDSLIVNGGKSVTLYVANVTSFNGFDRNPMTEGRDYKTLVRNRIDRISKKQYNDLVSVHTTDYKALFDRVSLRLSAPAGAKLADTTLPTDKQLWQYVDESIFNPELETLYFQFGRYLLISCSRTDGVPANLQGLWNEKVLPPWSCNYTSNINLQENYWAAETANLPEMHRSLMTYMKGLAVNGAETAKGYYGVDKGWCLGHNTDIWAMTNPIGINLDHPSWACWNMGGAWVSTHIWEHYTFSLDKSFLKEYYPVLKGAAEFCMGWLTSAQPYDGKDWLITAPSTSPENKFIGPDGKSHGTGFGGSADMAMIRECITDAMLAARELGTDKDFAKQAEATLTSLMPYQIGKRGNLQEWYFDFDDEDWQHRHQSHLFGLYPGHQYNAFMPQSNKPDGTNSVTALCNAAAKSLELKGDKTTGWSTGWRINLFARLNDAKNAYHIYRKLLGYISPDGYKGPDRRRGGGTYPNMLDAHTPFQIDGNFGGCAGVAEMLVQSEYAPQTSNALSTVTSLLTSPLLTTITLLPAIPQNWNTGSVTGIRARGGVTVDMDWQDGKVTHLLLHSTRKCSVSLNVNGTSKTVKLVKGKNEVEI